MKLNKQEQDGEEVPIITSDNYDINCSNKKYSNKLLLKSITKKYLLFFFLIILIFLLLSIFFYYFNNKELTHKITNLEQQLKILESKIEDLSITTIKKKIGIGVVQTSLYGNGMGRIISVLTELLAKTGKYDVYLINERISELDLPCYKGVKRVIQKKDQKEIEEFDRMNNIDIYILNNDLSNFIDIYKSLGKKVIGIFHGVFYSCIFTNHTYIYNHWHRFKLYDSFVQIIADDYYVYDKLIFNNNVFIPNLYTFEHTLTPSSSLTNKNVLIVGRIDDVIKGAKYGVSAMAEVVKKLPDAQLFIVSAFHDPKIVDLIKELKIENNTHLIPFTQNITEYYLNSSVLLVASVSESFPMVMNEGKAHGLPIVAFNVDYSPCFQKGVITVDLFDYKAMGNEVVKLLNNYEYRRTKGREAKLSLDMFKNKETIDTWGELFTSLLKGDDEYRKFQNKIKKKYYNEKIAKERMERHYKYAQQFNKHYHCLSFENFTRIYYLNNLKECNI